MGSNKAALKKRLDNTIMSVTEEIKKDLYENVIVSTVMDWFEKNSSIIDLNNSIKTNVESRWPFLLKRMESKFIDFEEAMENDLKDSKISDQDINVNEISKPVSEAITVALGALGTTFVAVIVGGAETALIASGPVGIVIGIVIGVVGYILGKDKLEDIISSKIKDKKILPIMKRFARKKVANELKLNSNKFEQEIYNLLIEQMKPVYEAIDNEME